MKFKQRTLLQIGDMICGNYPAEESFFRYRSSSYLTEFFQDADTNFVHNGYTRHRWVAEVLEQVLADPHPGPSTPPEAFCRIIQLLMDQDDAVNEGPPRPGALAILNAALRREGFEAFYAPDGNCYLRHIQTATVASLTLANPHRPFSADELERREALSKFLATASEDAMIEEILLPLFRQLGFLRITAAGHRDKALEYGKDVWMNFTLPTLHGIYFGIQVKRGKIDAAGQSRNGSANIAEIHNQLLMMLGHEVFDHETNKRVLVDHAFIIAGGEITKQAKAWLANALDLSKRSQILFMDRDDILNLYIATGLSVPEHQAARRAGR
jgi:hypothetical protein